jgi:hypothetical protein
MYATLRSYVTSDADRVRELVVDEVLPNLHDTSGLIAFYLIASGDGKLSSLTLAESEAAVERSNAQAAEWVRERFAGLVAGPPEVLSGEIVLEHRWDPSALEERGTS